MKTQSKAVYTEQISIKIDKETKDKLTTRVSELGNITTVGQIARKIIEDQVKSW